MGKLADSLEKLDLSEMEEWSVITALRGPDVQTDEMSILKYCFTLPLRWAIFKDTYISISGYAREALLPPVSWLHMYSKGEAFLADAHWALHMGEALRAIKGLPTLPSVSVKTYLSHVYEAFCGTVYLYGNASQRIDMDKRLKDLLGDISTSITMPTIRADFWLVD